MTKTFSFTTANNNTGKFFLNSKYTNASKALDDIIADSIIKKNSYLFGKKKYISLCDDPIYTGSALKADDDYIKATTFLANYKTNKTKYNIPYIYGKMYELSDGTPIVFYDDEIQIGFDTYKYSNFSDSLFLSTLKPITKKIIINIYNININL